MWPFRVTKLLLYKSNITQYSWVNFENVKLNIDFTSRIYVIKRISIFMCSERYTHNSCNSLKRISFNTRLWRNVRINRFVDKSLKVVFTGVLGRIFLAHNNSATITLHTRYLICETKRLVSRVNDNVEKYFRGNAERIRVLQTKHHYGVP